MRTNVADVYSAGDVASFPLAIRGDQRVNIGHWQMSHAQGKETQVKEQRASIVCLGLALGLMFVSFFFLAAGKVAALNMLNKPTKIESVPFFWTVLLGKSIRYTGWVFTLIT